VPESIEVFGKQLDNNVKVAGDRAKRLDEVLKSFKGQVR